MPSPRPPRTPRDPPKHARSFAKNIENHPRSHPARADANVARAAPRRSPASLRDRALRVTFSSLILFSLVAERPPNPPGSPNPPRLSAERRAPRRSKAVEAGGRARTSPTRTGWAKPATAAPATVPARTTTPSRRTNPRRPPRPDSTFTTSRERQTRLTKRTPRSTPKCASPDVLPNAPSPPRRRSPPPTTARPPRRRVWHRRRPAPRTRERRNPSPRNPSRRPLRRPPRRRRRWVRRRTPGTRRRSRR